MGHWQNEPMRIFILFFATAVAEIVGCYLPYLWLKQGKSIWLLVPAFLSLALLAWLLTLHETAAGRVYAAYGGVYVGVAIAWLWIVDQVRPTLWDSSPRSINSNRGHYDDCITTGGNCANQR